MSIPVTTNIEWLNITRLTHQHSTDDKDSTTTVSGVVIDVLGALRSLKSNDDLTATFDVGGIVSYSGLVTEVGNLDLLNRTVSLTINTQRWEKNRRLKSYNHGTLTVRQLAESMGVEWRATTEPSTIDIANQLGESDYRFLLRYCRASGLTLDSDPNGQAYVRDADTVVGDRITLPSDTIKVNTLRFNRTLPSETDDKTVAAASENAPTNTVTLQKRRLDIKSGRVRGGDSSDGSALTTVALPASLPSELRKETNKRKRTMELGLTLLPGATSIPQTGSLLRLNQTLSGVRVQFLAQVIEYRLSWNKGELTIVLECSYNDNS